MLVINHLLRLEATLKFRVKSRESRLNDIISVLQQSRLRWYQHVLRIEDNDWVNKCTDYEVGVPCQEVDQRGFGERLCKKTVKHVN